MSGLTEIMGRLGWSVPEGYSPSNVSVCRRCTHQILWCHGPNGRPVPLERDGTRHPFECRVTINAVHPREMGKNPLRWCPYCSHSTQKYTMSDLGLHIDAKHPIARTLPRRY